MIYFFEISKFCVSGLFNTAYSAVSLPSQFVSFVANEVWSGVDSEEEDEDDDFYADKHFILPSQFDEDVTKKVDTVALVHLPQPPQKRDKGPKPQQDPTEFKTKYYKDKNLIFPMEKENKPVKNQLEL